MSREGKMGGAKDERQLQLDTSRGPGKIKKFLNLFVPVPSGSESGLEAHGNFR